MSFIALVDYGMGNLLSVAKALEHVGGIIRVVEKPSEAEGASGIILPGVGNFGDGMEHLDSRGFSPLVKRSIASGLPFLGICLGMQMLLDSSEEAPGVQGLSVFKGKVKRFPECGEKIPHMGWNSISMNPECPYFKGVPDGSFFYFVHSYCACPEDEKVIAAKCHYIYDFAAALSLGNIFATQFHPEKSQERGLRLLKNFVEYCESKQTGKGS